MTRYKVTVEYDGGPFVGWQMQANGASVQAALVEAIRRFSGEDVEVRGAGRTDAGVHARAQVAHFDLAKEMRPDQIRDAINHHLKPAPVAVLTCEAVAADFDARFSATRREYAYVIINRRAPLTLDAGRAWRVPVPLDAEAMHDAAQVLTGKHDFTTFRSVQCQARSPVKTLDRLDVIRAGERITVHASARSFLHHQVRSMVGSLKLVGEGKWSADDLRAALEAQKRSACGPVAPACGLYLVGVGYDLV
ncbi:tRNA pseudouridine(38-40) synthase TruA [Dichotomicrobium thermohalophilum]|uniref:tRNA pseudouridine synthase A n=1 Tax=Dichotomicrobium thermohalophilum TaxID=933063 RepID=A0A397QEH0_9HYPH|nr:tRNA pseudouridine(38-40) synthase TruA [Dichotomicrobium thermohalophilum]RIA56661.1 tRNA pseudouridine38-40 synthase [Dichotomicrobium thermohalophilum]